MRDDSGFISLSFGSRFLLYVKAWNRVRLDYLQNIFVILTSQQILSFHYAICNYCTCNLCHEHNHWKIRLKEQNLTTSKCQNDKSVWVLERIKTLGFKNPCKVKRKRTWLRMTSWQISVTSYPSFLLVSAYLCSLRILEINQQ